MSMQGLNPTDGVRDADADADADMTCAARRDGVANRTRGPGPLEERETPDKFFETPARPTTATATVCSDDGDDDDACVIVIIGRA